MELPRGSCGPAFWTDPGATRPFWLALAARMTARCCCRKTRTCHRGRGCDPICRPGDRAASRTGHPDGHGCGPSGHPSGPACGPSGRPSDRACYPSDLGFDPSGRPTGRARYSNDRGIGPVCRPSDLYRETCSVAIDDDRHRRPRLPPKVCQKSCHRPGCRLPTR